MPEKLGREHVAFVEIRLSDTREMALQQFNRAVLKIPEVEQCHMIAGSFDYLLKVRTADILSFRRTLGESITLLPHVAKFLVICRHGGCERRGFVMRRYRCCHCESKCEEAIQSIRGGYTKIASSLRDSQ